MLNGDPKVVYLTLATVFNDRPGIRALCSIFDYSRCVDFFYLDCYRNHPCI
jgi:hypothetical protein